MPTRPIFLLMATVWAVAATPVAADWLVTRDGAELETRGPWKVRGSVVVFTQPNGTLSSLRVRELDLDRSAEVTAFKNATPAPVPEPERRVVWRLERGDVPQARSARVLVDDRVPLLRDADTAVAGEDLEGDGADPGPVSFYDRLAVTHWDKAEPSWLDGVELVGRLTNQNRTTALGISLSVRIFGDDGETLSSATAFLDRNSLLAGQSLEFRVPFEGVQDFADARFDVTATEVVLGIGEVDEYDRDEGEDTTGGG